MNAPMPHVAARQIADTPRPGPAAPSPARRAALAPLVRLRPVAGPVAAAAALLSAAGLWFWPGPAGLVALAAGAALALAAALARLVATGAAAHDPAALLAGDPDPVVLSDARGAGAWPAGQSPETLLADWLADPRPTIRAVLGEVRQAGHARRHLRAGPSAATLTAHAVGHGDCVLWRLTPADRPSGRELDALGLPVLTVDPAGGPARPNAALRRRLGAPAPGPPGAIGPDDGRPGEGTALLLDQVQPALARDLPGFALRMPGGQLALALNVPGFDGLRDVVVLPMPVPGQAGVAGLDAGGSWAPAAQDFEDLPVALLQIDAAGRIYGTNRAARTLMGLAAGEDRQLWEVVEGLGRPVADWLIDARAGRTLNRPEVMRAAAAPAETFVQITLHRAIGPAPPGALLAVVSDATELKSLEARFVQSQKMQAIGQLAGGIAHDFNNLLTAISGHCDLLLLGRAPYDPDYNDLEQIHQNANRAAALVRQLLAFSRKQTLRPEILALDELLDDLVRLLNRLVGERIALTLACDPDLGPIRADRRQLEQVIVNLVVNARDAMPMGGTIRIETDALALATPLAIGRVELPAGSWARIRVIDTGIGIPAALIDKIFEPFFTTKRPGEGTGLGLSTAYGIVKQMGGYIFVDSVEGSGTTFTLCFATEPARAMPAPPVDAQHGRSLSDGAASHHPQPADDRGRTKPGAEGTGAADTARRDPAGSAPPTLPQAPPAAAPARSSDGSDSAGPADAMPGPDPMPDEQSRPASAPRPGAAPRRGRAPAAPRGAIRNPRPDRPGEAEGAGIARPARAPAPGAPPGFGPAPDAPAIDATGTVRPGDAAGPSGRAAAVVRRGDGPTAPSQAPGGAARGTPAVPAWGASANPGGGATAGTGARPASAPAEGAAGDCGVVLLVEDEAPVRAFAARALRLNGHQVLEAEDGQQALEVLSDPALAVDVFVTDVIMPGLDGPGWVSRALLDRPGTPVVFVSGYIEDTLTEALGRTPDAVFLEKPFTLAQLGATIAERLRGRKP